jgi:hypothetical protein
MSAGVRWLVSGTACLGLLVAAGSSAGAQEPVSNPVSPAIEVVSDAAVVRIKAALAAAPASRLSIPSSPSVATFRTEVKGDYAAEFQASLRPILAFTDEEKKLIRATSPGGGIDPMAFVRAYKRVAAKLEARDARREVEALIKQLELAAAAQAQTQAAAKKTYTKQ